MIRAALVLPLTLVWGAFLGFFLACTNARPPLAYTDDPPGELDTAQTLQRRLQRSLDSLDRTPPGCSRDSLGGLFCPDTRPPRAP